MFSYFDNCGKKTFCWKSDLLTYGHENNNNCDYSTVTPTYYHLVQLSSSYIKFLSKYLCTLDTYSRNDRRQVSCTMFMEPVTTVIVPEVVSLSARPVSDPQKVLSMTSLTRGWFLSSPWLLCLALVSMTCDTWVDDCQRSLLSSHTWHISTIFLEVLIARSPSG